MQCDSDLRQNIESNLKNFQVIEQTAKKSAAVGLIVVEEGYGADLSDLPGYEDWQNSPALVLTRRSAKLSNHPGQWALPGGRRDEGETVEMTAIREAEEEINFTLAEENILGRLDDFVTRSGFVMTPIVFWGGKAAEMTPNPDEVASIHRIPVQELLREDAPILNYDEIKDEEKSTGPVLRMPIGDNWIAAPTAAIMYQFREVCILGKETRVAHFEQPHFAWR